MSLVGYRPLRYYERADEPHKRRLAAVPGYCQTGGRGESFSEAMARLDLRYLENRSFRRT